MRRDDLEGTQRMSALDCGFNRSTQQIVDIVQRAFRSLVFSLGDHLISSQQHLASLASWPKCHFLWGSTVSIARSYFHYSRAVKDSEDHRSRPLCRSPM